MSDLYEVRAVARDAERVTLRVTVVHGDVLWIFSKKNFALQLLWDAIEVSTEVPCPLLEALPERDITDPYYITTVGDDYIESVSIQQTNGEELAGYPDSVYRESTEDEPLSAILVIEATEERWVEHLGLHMQWTSAAYDMESEI